MHSWRHFGDGIVCLGEKQGVAVHDSRIERLVKQLQHDLPEIRNLRLVQVCPRLSILFGILPLFSN